MSLRRFSSSGFVIVGLLAVQAGPVVADDAVAIGYVESFEGSPKDFFVCRKSERQAACVRDLISKAEDREAIYALKPLYTEDCILFCRGQGEVTLLLADGDRETLVASNKCSTDSGGRTKPKSGSGAILASLARSFGGQSASTVVMARIKGDADQTALDFPMLFHRKPRIVAGERDFSVAWTGGAAPYRLVLTRHEDGATILEQAGLTRSNLPAAKAALLPGRYDLEVTDSRNAAIKIGFTAVGPEKSPVPPADLVPENFPSEIRRVSEAAWMAQQQDGRWMLEAYLRAAAGDADGYQPAAALRAVLRSGQVPGP